MSKRVDRTSLDIYGTNARLECSATALSHSVLAGVIGLFLPLTLKYIKIIPITIQSQSLMALVGCGTLSMLVLKTEMAYCPPDDLPQKTTRV